MILMEYDSAEIEKKWQDYWEKEQVFKTEQDTDKHKFYCLDMFPYPSGEGLHVGHPRGYVATDTFSHFKRMRGFNVLHPMGWDAFGLPAENYAIKTGIHPKATVEENIKKFKAQLKSIGFSYDWEREINTTDKEYFKWTQWIFLKLFENGLAYEDTRPINWCPSCKTGLANEEVVNGLCERCDAQIEKKDIRQWVLRITKYADRLLEDLEELDWPEPIKEMQRNWIGRSVGAEIKFSIKGTGENIEVFTTRSDTLFGATFLVLAPEHGLVKKVLTGEMKAENKGELEEYVKKARKKSELERTELSKEKTGVELKGIKAVNPVNGEEIPVWVADYVLGFYGKGGIMSVPAHDDRDYEMAQKYGLEIKQVIEAEELPYAGEGKMINSGEFTGMDSQEGNEKIIEKLEKEEKGKKAVNYKLGDWVFSRQRYWGEPMPLVFCSECKKKTENHKLQAPNYKQIQNSKSKVQNNKEFSEGELLNPGWVALEEKSLPLALPEVESYKPTGTGESPLTGIESFVNAECPKCKGKGRRETNTMPQWAGSCWYYLAFIMKGSSKNLEFPPSLYKEDFKKWLPVDVYVGGAEHAVLHLLYARFWHKFLYDIGFLETKEPFYKLKNQGLIMGEGGIKMSKSKGNIISPDEVIKMHGADVLRLYEMFLGGFDDEVAWSEKGVSGMKRFLEKVNETSKKAKENTPPGKLESPFHKTIKKVTEDVEGFKFNTAISALMAFNNEMRKEESVSKDIFSDFIKLLAPFAPHFAEEIWEGLGRNPSIFHHSWPVFDDSLIKDKEITLVLQVNGKVRDTVEAPADTQEEELKKMALESKKVGGWIKGKSVKKMVVVKDKLVNIVTD